MTDLRGRILAKTGRINNVCCLSGYVLDTTSRPRLAFALPINRFRMGTAWKAKQLHDSLCRLMVAYVDATVPTSKPAGRDDAQVDPTAAPVGAPARRAATTRPARPQSPRPGP